MLITNIKALRINLISCYSLVKPHRNNMTSSHNTVSAINAFSDNYIWAIGSNKNDFITLVDPGDAKVCIDFIEKNNKILTDILITHHHADHVGGINELVQYGQQKSWSITIHGPANETIPHRNVALVENDTVTLPELELTLNVIDLPGHTLGHIAFSSEEYLFCGDTLFSGGCGRLFEGTPQQMHDSLGKLSHLSPNTLVFCAHEYTAANLHFALTVDPENSELINYFNQVTQLREQGVATIPTTIGLEKQINPFLRCQEVALQQSASDYNNQKVALGVDTFSVIRQWKNNF